VLQCVAVRRSVLQCVAVCREKIENENTVNGCFGLCYHVHHFNFIHTRETRGARVRGQGVEPSNYTAVSLHCSVLQCVAVCCSVSIVW